MADAPSGPTALRIVLGTQLRRLREARGMRPADAARAIRATDSKISRLELGRSAVREIDVVDLLTLYGVTDHAEREQVLALAARSNEPGWWHRYNDLLPDWLQSYIGLEQAAQSIRTYETQFVPGLLQSEGYASAIMALGDFPPEEMEQRVALRKERQRRFLEGDLWLWAVIDEAVLRRGVGDPRAMRDQLGYLLEMSERPNLTLQVTPFNSAGHAALTGFSILRFSEPDLTDIVYVEHLTSALYLDKRADVDAYLLAMERLAVISAPPADSAGLIQAIRAAT
ncbi:MAG: helix-turn-helix domain-containing protein [Nocardiopsaceae bacterium]|jgi:transcriptional regulator with XRE-family HTH domain|nr:helix-turn-helix domain-containing protein [Nocardiopsaceae bacterium]